MPVTEIRKINDQTFLGFWHITETIPELLAQLKNVRPAKDIPAYKSDVRQKEWLASRILAYQLLEKFSAEKFVLHSNEHGKPYFTETNLHVSISQSAELVGVVISSAFEVGIDIEKLKPKALKLAFKFLSEQELTYIQNDETKACLYWSAKETLFKMYSRKQLHFIENLNLDPVPEAAKGSFTGRVKTANFDRSYTVHYEIMPHFILTYCLASPQDFS